MELRINDYVRTRWGCIAKFEGIHEGFYEFDNIIIDESSAVREELFVDIVEKSSPNIIDLIEVGDYVNGKKVIKVWEEPFGEFAGQIFTILDGEETAPTIREIKSIVTKEQFEEIEYKIGE